MAEELHQRVGDELPRLLELTLVLGGLARVGEERVVGGAGLVGVVGIGHVEEGEERPVAMGLEPGGEAVDVDSRAVLLGSLPGSEPSSCSSSNPWCRFVSLPMKSTDDRPRGGVAGLAVGLGEGDGRAGQPILELLDAVGVG